MTFGRGDLRDQWNTLYQTVSKPAVIQRKVKLIEQLA